VLGESVFNGIHRPGHGLLSLLDGSREALLPVGGGLLLGRVLGRLGGPLHLPIRARSRSINERNMSALPPEEY
jgi:hypothetical protein